MDKSSLIYLRTIMMAVVAIALFPAIVHADIIWPAIIIEEKLLSVWAIGIGLIIELGVLYWGFNLGLKKAIYVDVSMNLISTLLGIILIPLSGLLLEVFPGLLFNIFHIGTFNPITWCCSFIVAVLITSFVEIYFIKNAFKVIFNRNRVYMFIMANISSVAVAFILLWIKPHDYK